jgi:hypothetical protein
VSAPCTPLTVIEVGGTTPTFTEETGVDIDATGDNAGLALDAGSPTCCGEVNAIVGVFYNAQWSYDGSVTYGATVA